MVYNQKERVMNKDDTKKKRRDDEQVQLKPKAYKANKKKLV